MADIIGGHRQELSDFEGLKPADVNLHPSKARRKNFKVIVEPPGRARGQRYARRTFRGKGADHKLASGKGSTGFVRGDRIFTSEEAIWLRPEDPKAAAKRDAKKTYKQDAPGT